MGDNSNIVWSKKPNEYLMDSFHMRQYNEEYESIKFIKKHTSNLNFNTLIDCGCCSGALIYYLKRNIKI